jgi:predicted amidohydrolase
MCNRVGQESEMNFSGESIVVNQNGEAIKKAGDQEEIIYVDIDLSDSKKIRESRLYTQLKRTKFYRKLSCHKVRFSLYTCSKEVYYYG